MANGTQPEDNASKMRANRKTLESSCSTCLKGFVFGEEVYPCAKCGGFHHAACYESRAACQGVFHPPPVPGEETLASFGSPMATVPPAIPLTEVKAARRAPGPDEQYCGQCAEIVKREALKCRFCGYAFNAGLATDQISSYIAKEVDSWAGKALTYGILSFVCFGPVFAPLAISNGNKALREMDQYPNWRGPRGKAEAGRILGWICVSFMALYLFVVIISAIISVANR